MTSFCRKEESGNPSNVLIRGEGGLALPMLVIPLSLLLFITTTSEPIERCNAIKEVMHVLRFCKKSRARSTTLECSFIF